MPGMPWMKIWTEMLDDVKLAELDDSQKWRFIQLILLAGECDADGAFVTGESRMTHTQIAWRLRCDKNELERDIQKMLSLGLLTDDNGLIITKFRERQGPTQAEKRQKWAERQQKRRESSNVTSESRVTSSGVTYREEEEEEELINGSEKSEPKKKREISPEMKAYYSLQKHFLGFTGLPEPKPKTQGEWKEFNTLWASPGKSILSWVNGDMNKAQILVEEAVSQMTKDRLTIANFKSIVKVASDCYRSRNNGRA